MKSSWNSNLYDNKHSYVSGYGESLIEWLLPQAKEKICDLGCGTGDLANLISESKAEVVGIDSSATMVEQAKKKYPDIEFQIQDVKNLSFHEEFEAVFSNATLHWVKEQDQPQAIKSIWNSLKPSGRLVAEFGGKNNIQKIVEGINNALDHFGYSENKSKNPWGFLSVGEYTTLLEKQGFIVRDVCYYERPTKLDQEENGLRNWLEMFAFFFFENIEKETLEKIITHIEDELRPHLFKEGNWFADYRRLRIKAERG